MCQLNNEMLKDVGTESAWWQNTKNNIDPDTGLEHITKVVKADQCKSIVVKIKQKSIGWITEIASKFTVEVSYFWMYVQL